MGYRFIVDLEKNNKIVHRFLIIYNERMGVFMNFKKFFGLAVLVIVCYMHNTYAADKGKSGEDNNLQVHSCSPEQQEQILARWDAGEDKDEAWCDVMAAHGVYKNTEEARKALSNLNAKYRLEEAAREERMRADQEQERRVREQREKLERLEPEQQGGVEGRG